MSNDPTENNKIHIITVVYDESEKSPKVDLGDIPPSLAITIMQQTVAALFDCLREPIIEYDGRTIYSPIIFEEDDEA